MAIYNFPRLRYLWMTGWTCHYGGKYSTVKWPLYSTAYAVQIWTVADVDPSIVLVDVLEIVLDIYICIRYLYSARPQIRATRLHKYVATINAVVLYFYSGTLHKSYASKKHTSFGDVACYANKGWGMKDHFWSVHNCVWGRCGRLWGGESDKELGAWWKYNIPVHTTIC